MGRGRDQKAKEMKRKYSYEDEKRDALNSYLSTRPYLKEQYVSIEQNLKLMQIKVDIQVVARSSIKRFRSKCDAIIRGLKK